MPDIATGRKHVPDDFEVSDCRRIDIEDRNPLRLPKRNQIQAVQAPDDADHVNILVPLWFNAFVVGPELRELLKRSVLTAVIGAVENHFRTVMIDLAIEGPGC